MTRLDLKNYIESFKEKNGFLNKKANITNLSKFFSKLSFKINKQQPEALIIGHYLYENISSDQVRKRKVSARDFEDVLALIFDGGEVLDNNKRKNIKLDLKRDSDLPKEILNYIASNRREKMDVYFNKNFGVSVKTSMPDNKEINMGSFAREALFFGFLTPNEYGGERKSGLGSKPQLMDKFKKIHSKGLWKKFVLRFIQMMDLIFVDDLLIAVKNNTSLDLYFLDGKKLRNAFSVRINKGPEEIMKIINRYEGNSIRIDRKVLTLGIKPVILNFSGIEKTSYYKINKGMDSIGILIRDAYRNPGDKKSKLKEARNTMWEVFREIGDK
jgi:hypothetical protein